MIDPLENSFCKILHDADEMLPYFPVVIQMPYDFTSLQYAQYLHDMIPNGYHQMVMLQEEECLAVAGFWINTKLYCGKYVELDNVIVDRNHQGKGIGKIICRQIEEEAMRLGCTIALLDAYVENAPAHKFYFREGYRIRGYHFLKNLR